MKLSDAIKAIKQPYDEVEKDRGSDKWAQVQTDVEFRLRGLIFSRLPQIEAMEQRIDDLESAIRAHRAQKADDRCIEDDDRLYEALGDGIKCDRRVGDKAQMLQNCARFIARRCEGGGWKSYVELEQEVERLRHRLTQCQTSLRHYQDASHLE